MQNICCNCFHYAPEGGACPYCGYDPRENEGRYRLALKPGTILVNRYLVGRVLGQGGFGITYVALDHETKSRVAVKEYMPTEYAFRDEGSAGLLLNDNSVRADFEYGKEQFLQEARTLAAFVGNEHIIGVRDLFEANGTAYFAMEFAEGVDLKKYMEQNGGPLRICEANRILLPVMEALQWVHSKGIVHRDISPDNIMVKRDGTAKLIDFGAARYSTGEKSRSLDVILKHGFAPVEQYSRRGRQGPFTDVYAMAATYYYAITGRVPPDAVERMTEDRLQPPGALGVNMKEDTEQVLMKALALNAQDRWQTMAAFCSALLRTMPQPFAPGAGEGAGKGKRPAERKEKKPKPAAAEGGRPAKRKPAAVIAAVLILAVLAGAAFGAGVLKKSPAADGPVPSAAPAETAEATPEVPVPAETPDIPAPAETAEVPETVPPSPTSAPVYAPLPLTGEQYVGSVSDYTELVFTSASASSELTEDGILFAAGYAIDDKSSRPWVEGVKGSGVGETLRLSFDETESVRLLSFRLGYAKSRDLYKANNRPSRLHISFSDGSGFDFTFQDINQEQVVRLSRAADTDYVELTVLDVYRGNYSDDTCIYRVRAYA